MIDVHLNSWQFFTILIFVALFGVMTTVVIRSWALEILRRLDKMK